jgi:hypothetical protein
MRSQISNPLQNLGFRVRVIFLGGKRFDSAKGTPLKIQMASKVLWGSAIQLHKIKNNKWHKLEEQWSINTVPPCHRWWRQPWSLPLKSSAVTSYFLRTKPNCSCPTLESPSKPTESPNLTNTNLFPEWPKTQRLLSSPLLCNLDTNSVT